MVGEAGDAFGGATHAVQRFGAGVGVEDVELDVQAGQRGAQLVGGVLQEAALGANAAVETLQQGIEGFDHAADLGRYAGRVDGGEVGRCAGGQCALEARQRGQAGGDRVAHGGDGGGDDGGHRDAETGQ